MTKLDTKKYVAHIVIGAILSPIIFLIVLRLCQGKGWMYDYYIVAALVASWILAAPLAFLSMWLDKTITLALGKKWDGGLGWPGTYGPLVIGITVILIVFAVRGWILHL